MASVKVAIAKLQYAMQMSKSFEWIELLCSEVNTYSLTLKGESPLWSRKFNRNRKIGYIRNPEIQNKGNRGKWEKEMKCIFN